LVSFVSFFVGLVPGLVSGLAGSLVGMGGAFIAVPAMTGLLGVTQHMANGK